jgi:hypothetical protein
MTSTIIADDDDDRFLNLFKSCVALTYIATAVADLYSAHSCIFISIDFFM